MSAELRAEFRVGSKDVARDVQRGTDVVQKETARAFRGGGTSGLLHNPASTIAGIAGIQGVFKSAKKFSDIALPELENLNKMLSRKSFFNRSIRGLPQPNYAGALAGINSMGSIPFSNNSITGLNQPNYGRALAGIHSMGSIPLYHGPKPPVLPPQQQSFFSTIAGKLLGFSTVIGGVVVAFNMLKKATTEL